jgi:hypothetical protein
MNYPESFELCNIPVSFIYYLVCLLLLFFVRVSVYFIYIAICYQLEAQNSSQLSSANRSEPFILIVVTYILQYSELLAIPRLRSDTLYMLY